MASDNGLTGNLAYFPPIRAVPAETGAYWLSASERPVDKHVPLFKVRLIAGQSIGPQSLRSLWSKACGSNDVSVSRQAVRGGPAEKPNYLLHGRADTADLPAIEKRLRALVAESNLSGSISAMHH